MADAALEWKGDFDLTDGGDLLLVDGVEETRERIMRRLFTVTRGLVFHQSYGAGLPERIGRVAKTRNIQALVRGQIAMESTVARNPVPVITVSEAATSPGLFLIDIRYTDAVTGAAIAISLEVPGQA